MTHAPPQLDAELVGHFEEGSPQWHAARAQGLGGSEIAAVLGLSKWESRFSLWHRKKGAIPPKTQNSEMDAGKRFEDAICRKFADNHPDMWTETTGTWRNRARPWQVANPDRLIYPAGACPCIAVDGLPCTPGCARPTEILEAKLALYPDEWGEEGTDQVPPYYLAQCRWYLDTFGLTRCYLQVYIGACGEFREYIIDVDPGDQKLMRDRADEFITSLDTGPRPDIDDHSATYTAIKQLHPRLVDENVEIPPLLAMEYEAACGAYTGAKADKQAAASKVLDAIGDGRAAVCDGHLIATRIVYGDPDDPTIALRPAKTSKPKGTAA